MPIERGEHATPEAQGILVVRIQRDPCNALGGRSCPLRDRGRLAESGGRGHDGERMILHAREALQHGLAHDGIGSQLRDRRDIREVGWS